MGRLPELEWVSGHEVASPDLKWGRCPRPGLGAPTWVGTLTWAGAWTWGGGSGPGLGAPTWVGTLTWAGALWRGGTRDTRLVEGREPCCRRNSPWALGVEGGPPQGSGTRTPRSAVSGRVRTWVQAAE